MSREAVFRGIPVVVVQSRVRARQADRFYYEIRHSEDDWASPATLEEKVSVNFWGTVVSPEKIDFGGDDYVEMTDAEMKTLMVDQGDDEGERSHGS